MAQEAQLLATQRALGGLDIKLLLTQDRKYLPDIRKMLLQGRAVAEEVVHIDHHRPMQRAGGPRDTASRGGARRRGLAPRLAKPASHGRIHDPHEDGGGALQSEGHDLPFELTKL